MSKPDEKAIERDFCAGELSLQDVADKHGITIKALRYMAGKRGWKRNKGARAKAGQKNGAKNNSAPKKRPKKSSKILMASNICAGKFPMKKIPQRKILIWHLILMNSDFLTSTLFLFIGM